MALTPEQLAQIQALMRSTSPGQTVTIDGHTYGTVGTQTQGEGGGYTPSGIIEYDPTHMGPGEAYSFIDPATGQATSQGKWQNGGDTAGLISSSLGDLAPAAGLLGGMYLGGQLLGGLGTGGAGAAAGAANGSWDVLPAAAGTAGTAGATAAGAGTAAGLGSTTAASTAAGTGAGLGAGLGGVGSALGGIGSALGGAGTLLGAGLGAAAGAAQGPQTQTTTRTMDPRMDPFVYGSNGVLQTAQNLYNANPSGINPAMQAGWDQIMAVAGNPQNQAAYQSLVGTGQGLLGRGVAGNPTGGQMPQGSNLMQQYMAGTLHVPQSGSAPIPGNINLPTINGQALPGMPQMPSTGLLTIPTGQVMGQPVTGQQPIPGSTQFPSSPSSQFPSAPTMQQQAPQSGGLLSAAQTPRGSGLLSPNPAMAGMSRNTPMPGETQQQFLARLNAGVSPTRTPTITPSAFHTDATTGMDTMGPEYQQSRLAAYAQNQSDAAAGRNQTPWDASSYALGPATTSNTGPMNFASMNGSTFDSLLPDISRLPKLPDMTGGLNVPQAGYRQYTGDPKTDAALAESNWQLASSYMPGGTYAQTMGYGDPRNQQLGAGYSNVGAFSNYGVMPGNVNPARQYDLSGITLGDLGGAQNEYGMIDAGLQQQMKTYNDILGGHGAWTPDQANIYDLQNANFGMTDTLNNFMGNWDQYMNSAGNFNSSGPRRI